MFVEREGSIFSSGADALVNPVNCIGVMGAGLALQFARRFPAMLTSYAQACDTGELHIGSIHHWRDPASLVYVVNFPTMEFPGEDAKLETIEVGLHRLATAIPLFDPEINSIAIPALGCGIGGLRWKQVKHLIEANLKSLSTDYDIYLYPPL